MPEYLTHWFKEAVERDLLPLFPRAKLQVCDGKKNPKKLVALDGKSTALKFGLPDQNRFSLRLSRSTSFTLASRNLVQNYCELISKAQKTWQGPLVEVSGLAMRRLVAQTVLPEAADTAVLVLDHLAAWAEETYEGKKVAAAVLVDCSRAGLKPSLKEIFSLPCSHIVSDGVDSWLVVDRDGNLLQNLNYAAKGPQLDKKIHPPGFFYPYKYQKIANETRIPRTMAAVLNRNGEILVFARGRLLFAKRRGSWRFFDHLEVIKALSTGGNNSPINRRAIYVSCLDASFARCGAGCAIIPKNKVKSDLLAKLVSPNDRIDKAITDKSKLLKNIVLGRPFNRLTRHTRRELLGIDGATVVSSTGTILAVGAKVKVGSGSSGGGRRAAAKALSKLGVALKVSADGKISVFRQGLEEPVFEVG